MLAIADLEADTSLSDSADLAGRADLLDTLDLLLAHVGSTPDLLQRAEALRAQVEALDVSVADDLRARIVARAIDPAGLRAELRRSVRMPARGGRASADQYDNLDLLISRAFGLTVPSGPIAELPPDMVAYQPTPARWLLDLAERAGIAAQDVFVDLGAGLGQAAILMALLSGARAIGIEIEPAYVAVARRSASLLGLARVSFRAEDAIGTDLSAGTVFYLYTPFVGAPLGRMLARLRQEAVSHPIRVCAYGPCVPTVAAESWLALALRCGPLYILDSPR